MGLCWDGDKLFVTGDGEAARAYVGTNSTILGTWPHGAITVRRAARGAWAETFRSGRRLALAGADE